METPPEGKSFRVAPFAAHASRGLIRDQGARRKMMLGSVVVAVLLAVVGSTLLKEILDPRAHPVWFILFWAACAWMTILAVLLALFDMLIVRAQARAARRELGTEVSSTKKSAE